jgi:ankyrin repeat protein
VDPISKNYLSRTLLSFATEKRHEKVFKVLLATEVVDLDPKDSNGQTPLSRVAYKGHEAVVKLLLTQRVNKCLANNYGRTPLFWRHKKGTTQSSGF